MSDNTEQATNVLSRVRAKFTVQSRTEYSYGSEVKLSAVHSAAGENADFADATPQGALSLHISKGRPAERAFIVGQNYYLDITPAE